MNNHYSKIYSSASTNTYYKFTNNPNDPFDPTFKTTYPNVQTDLNDENLNGNYDQSNITIGKTFITLNTDDNSYVNCAVQTSVPWFTMSDDYKKCEIVKNLDYDETRIKIEKVKDNTIVSPILVSKNNNKTASCAYFSNVNKAYCENAWYDWIITPNYHLGNTYYKDNSQYSELDVYKCYAPCSGDYLPYATETGELKCIPKKFFGSGIFNRKYMYNSIVLINLIGNIACTNNDEFDKDHKNTDYFSTNLLYILHRLIYEYNISNKIDNHIYDINNNIQNKIRLKSATNQTDNYDNRQTIFNSNMKYEYDKIYTDIKNVLENDVLKNYDNNKDKDYLNLNEFTYKNARFHENEPEMFSYTGMETHGVLTPPILIHTWMLSQIFKPLERNFFNYDDKFFNMSSSENNQGDINICNRILRQTLYYKLGKIFNDNNKAIRLKNIFFKAISNCYDGKSTFSVNFISATKKALKNAELLKIINDNTFYYFPNNINFIKSLEPIPEPGIAYELGKSYKNYLVLSSSDLINPATTNINATTIKTNLNSLLICDDKNITNLIESLKYYKDTDLIELYSILQKTIREKSKTTNKYEFPLQYFIPPPNTSNSDYKTIIPPKLYCHYLFSIEELEKTSCPEGSFYNPNVKECEKLGEMPEVVEEKTNDEDDINIPDLSNIMRIFLQIVIVAVILYLIYIIYDMFGEFILSTINYIIVNFWHVGNGVNFKFMDFISGTNPSDKLDTEGKKLDKMIKLSESELENLQRKEEHAIEYNNEVIHKQKAQSDAEALK
jgi:hypothetical protein